MPEIPDAADAAPRGNCNDRGYCSEILRVQCPNAAIPRINRAHRKAPHHGPARHMHSFAVTPVRPWLAQHVPACMPTSSQQALSEHGSATELVLVTVGQCAVVGAAALYMGVLFYNTTVC